jgi:hypothetical protein
MSMVEVWYAGYSEPGLSGAPEVGAGVSVLRAGVEDLAVGSVIRMGDGFGA